MPSIIEHANDGYVKARCYVRMATTQRLRVSDWHRTNHRLANDNSIKAEALGIFQWGCKSYTCG